MKKKEQVFLTAKTSFWQNTFRLTVHFSLYMIYGRNLNWISNLNEVYVDMSELNFPTQLIHLTKAILTIVTCCVKIHNDCSEPFETRQRLRQGDVFSTLVCKVVRKLSHDEQTYKKPGHNLQQRNTTTRINRDIVGRITV
jgi:hypothetical protein